MAELRRNGRVFTNTTQPLENGGGASSRLLGGGIELQLSRDLSAKTGRLMGHVTSPWLDSNTTELRSKALPVGHWPLGFLRHARQFNRLPCYIVEAG